MLTHIIPDKRYDTGDKLGYAQAFINLALENEDIKRDIFEYFKEIVQKEETIRTI